MTRAFFAQLFTKFAVGIAHIGGKAPEKPFKCLLFTRLKNAPDGLRESLHYCTGPTPTRSAA